MGSPKQRYGTLTHFISHPFYQKGEIFLRVAGVAIVVSQPVF